VGKTFTGTEVFPVSIIPPLAVLRMLVLSEAQTVEGWEPSKKQCSVANRETLD
jgi:hypothetical protein